MIKRAVMRRKAGYWMRREILEQPEVVERVLAREENSARRLGRLLRERRVGLAVLAARGTSDHAATAFKYVLEWSQGIPAALAAPSIATVYGRTLRLRGAAALGVSQSGRSPDVVEYVAGARRAGAVAVAVTNAPRSPLAKAAGRSLLCHAGPERSVAATKTFTAQLACLYLLAAAWKGGAEGERLLGELRRVPEALRAALAMEEGLAEEAFRARGMERCVVLGRGFAYPVALETALKLKEAAGVFAEGASAADFLHGPVSMALRSARREGFRAVLCEAPGAAAASLRRAARSLAAAGVRSIFLRPPAVPEWLAPFPLAVLGQLAAFHLARAKGLDPDRPAGLRKVTRTR